MPYITLGAASELQIKVPTIGSTGWADTLRTDTFLKIAEHNHTGSGNGSQLGTGSILADAITGAKIRLDNNEYIRARNAADSANINLIKVDANDDAYIDPDLAKLNLKNSTYLTGRNNADSADVNILRVNTSDKLELSPEISAVVKVSNNIALQHRNVADSAYIDTIKVNASDKIALGADLANAAIITNTNIQSRNNADSGYVNLIKSNTSDKIELGAQIAVANMANNTYFTGRDQADSANVNIIKVNATDGLEILDGRVELSGSATLTDNTSVAASAGIITLTSNESAIIEYKIIRSTDVVSGILELEQSNANINREEIGDDVGVTFSLNAGALEYTTTSTGNNATITYNIIRR